MLAIVRNALDHPSETFIRSHIRTIAPAATVLICARQESAASLHYPTLAVPFALKDRFDQDRVRQFLRHYKVEVMLAEFVRSGWRFRRACRAAKIKLFVHVHGFDVSVYVKKPLWIQRYRTLFEHADGIIAPSRFLANKLSDLGCPPEKLHVSPSGVDPNRFKPGAGDSLRLLSVGRLVEKKAPQLTIRAFADVFARFPHAHLDIIGDGPLREECLSLIRELGLGDAIRLHGAQASDQVIEAMRRASVFVQHSVTTATGDTEGFPVGILEAMASGLPVVATRHSGIPESVVEGLTGILVDENDVTGMSRAIIELLMDPARASAMGMAGRQRVLSNFTETHMRDRLRAIMGLSAPWRWRNSLRRSLIPEWNGATSNSSSIKQPGSQSTAVTAL